MKTKYLLSTRFTDETWVENEAHRTIHTDVQCIYGSPQPMPPKIDPRLPVCVVEMNNSHNKIMGIGLIRNEPTPRSTHIVYNTGNYNRYVFTGRHRMDRDELPQHLLDILDYILFKEKTHLKRGAGFTTVPDKLLCHRVCEGRDIVKEIIDAFVRKYKDPGPDGDSAH
jgi:hypothetical protein